MPCSVFWPARRRGESWWCREGSSMSSFDQAVRVSLILLAVAGLAACSVEPLYGSGPAGTVVKASLAGIDVAPVDTKIAQDLRNRLLFDLSGTASPAAAPRYSLKLDVAPTELAL